MKYPGLYTVTNSFLDATDPTHFHGLMLTARRVLEGLYAGHHRSRHGGPDVDFHHYRAYCPGDEVAQIDWKLFGRTNRYYVRQQRRLSSLQVYVMVDRTASMNFAGANSSSQNRHEPTKLAHAKTVAAAIAMLSVRQGDQVGLGLFSSQIDRHIPMGGTWPHLNQICSALEQTEAAPGIGDMGDVLQQAHHLVRRRGLVVLIADLLDEPKPLMDGLSRLRHDRFDVIVIQVLTRQELDLSQMDRQRLQIVDAETRQSLATSPPLIWRRYNRLVSQHIAVIRQGCNRLGIDHHLVTTDLSAVEALRQILVGGTRNKRLF